MAKTTISTRDSVKKEIYKGFQGMGITHIENTKHKMFVDFLTKTPEVIQAIAGSKITIPEIINKVMDSYHNDKKDANLSCIYSHIMLKAGTVLTGFGLATLAASLATAGGVAFASAKVTAGGLALREYAKRTKSKQLSSVFSAIDPEINSFQKAAETTNTNVKDCMSNPNLARAMAKVKQDLAKL
ncbi:MAG: hypothetical protein CMP22_01005 [Rickettsiales bacterium]|nr:hypothetical protein [Rickettsiales bacterium]|tara:strand:+ start:189 stop:743 length:555 start_codon:yes stop_codon:yes gene_type:complete